MHIPEFQGTKHKILEVKKFKLKHLKFSPHPNTLLWKSNKIRYYQSLVTVMGNTSALNLKSVLLVPNPYWLEDNYYEHYATTRKNGFQLIFLLRMSIYRDLLSQVSIHSFFYIHSSQTIFGLGIGILARGNSIFIHCSSAILHPLELVSQHYLLNLESKNT